MKILVSKIYGCTKFKDSDRSVGSSLHKVTSLTKEDSFGKTKEDFCLRYIHFTRKIAYFMNSFMNQFMNSKSKVCFSSMEGKIPNYEKVD